MQRQVAAIFGDCVRHSIGIPSADVDLLGEIRQCVRAASAIGAKPDDIVLAIRAVYWEALPWVERQQDFPDDLVRLIGCAIGAYDQGAEAG